MSVLARLQDQADDFAFRIAQFDMEDSGLPEKPLLRELVVEARVILAARFAVVERTIEYIYRDGKSQ